MALNSRGLGRGLDALFDGNARSGAEAAGSPMLVPIDLIEANPQQPRKTFDADKLNELAASIREQGILQPLVVRPASHSGRYQLIAGERRLRASKLAELKEVPVVIRHLDDQEALVCTLMENLQRDDLNPVEEALGLQALKTALNCNVDMLAAKLGQGRSSIFHALRLLKLEDVFREDVMAGRLSASHAKAMGAMDSAEARLKLRERILAEDLTVRATEHAIAQWQTTGRFPWEEEMAPETLSLPEGAAEAAPASVAEAVSAEQTAEPGSPPAEESQVRAPQTTRSHGGRVPEIDQLAKDIGAALHCHAKITGTQERGHISIAYESTQQLNELLGRMGISLASLTLSSPPLSFD